MKTLNNYIQQLRQHHGSHSQAARQIGLDVRNFRRGRNGNFSRQARILIATSGKLLTLQCLVRNLVAMGEVSPQALKAAWQKIKAARP